MDIIGADLKEKGLSGREVANGSEASEMPTTLEWDKGKGKEEEEDYY